MIILSLVLLWFLSTLIRTVTMILSSVLSGAAARTIVGQFLPWGTSVTALIIFLYAIVTLAGTLTYRSDLKLLLLSPVSPRLILAEKILAVSLGFSPLLLLSLPAVIGIGHALHLGLGYDLMALALVVLVPVGPVSLAMLILLALLRLVPPARVQGAAVVLGTVLSGALFVGMQSLMSPTSSIRPGFSPPSIPGAVPATWAGHALAALVLGRPTTGLLYFLATVALAALLYGLAITLSARVLVTGSANYGEVRRKAAPGQTGNLSSLPGRREAFPAGHLQAVPAGAPRPITGLTVWPLLVREWRSLRRDPQRLAALAYPLVIVAFYAYRIVSLQGASPPGSGEHAGPFLVGSLDFMLTITAILLIGSIAPSLINHEGRSLYLLALAPVSSRDVLLGKWLMCAAPALVLVEAMLGAAAVFLHLPAGRSMMTALVMAALIIAQAGLTLAINLVWPRFNPSGGRQQASFPAVVVSMAGQLLLGGAVFILLLLATGTWTSLPLAALAAIAAVVVLTASISFASMWLGSRQLQRLLTSDPTPR